MPLPHQHHQPGVTVEQRHHHQPLALRPRADRVFVKAGDHVDGSTHQRSQCLRTSPKIGDVDVEAFILEESQLAGDSEGEIDELRLSSDRHLDRGPGLRPRTGRKEQPQKGTKDTKTFVNSVPFCGYSFVH